MMDLISRDAVLSLPRDTEKTLSGMIINQYVNIRDIEELPTVQPEQQWIPCSETVDIPEHEVLACDKYGEQIIGFLVYADDQWLCESTESMMYDPIAWMPLPKPYKERREE